MWFSYHSGTIFEHFGCWNIRCYLGAVLGGSEGVFWRLFGLDLVDFEGSKESQISSSFSKIFRAFMIRAGPLQRRFSQSGRNAS